MTAADDVNLDDLKRRARRRLVGAIVLALVVAVVVPMLLESEPKPLGEDVAVKIPPVDDGKFVNRLSDRGKQDASTGDGSKSGGKADPKIEASKAAPEAAPRKADTAPASVAGTSGAKGETDTASPGVVNGKADAGKNAAGEHAKADSPPPPAAAPAPAASLPATSAPAGGGTADAPAAASAKAGASGSTTIPAATANGLFAVQVYAFSDVYGANSLVNKLKRVGYPAYSEPTTTSKGQLWRVRIGPYPSREVAATARDKLKGEGYNGIVTTR